MCSTKESWVNAMRSFENGTLTMDGDPILGMPPLNKMRYSTVQYSTVHYNTLLYVLYIAVISIKLNLHSINYILLSNI